MIRSINLFRLKSKRSKRWVCERTFNEFSLWTTQTKGIIFIVLNNYLSSQCKSATLERNCELWDPVLAESQIEFRQLKTKRISVTSLAAISNPAQQAPHKKTPRMKFKFSPNEGSQSLLISLQFFVLLIRTGTQWSCTSIKWDSCD